MTIKVKGIEARVFVHATENRDKVVRALTNVIGQRNIVEEVLKGYFGNQIIVLTAFVEQDEAEGVLRKIISSLPDSERAYLEATLEDRLDRDGNLHLRLDKQRAYLGRISLSDSDDVIKLVVRLSGSKKSSLDDLVKYLFGSGTG